MKTIFVNPCHGNEPYILGGLIALGVSKHLEETTGEKPRIIIPHLYGNRQKRIMQEEGLLAENVALDEKLGDLYHPITFADNNIAKTLRDLIAKRDDTEKAIREHLQKEHGTISLEINAGAQITSGNQVPSVLAYPGVYSELYAATLANPELLAQLAEEPVEENLQKCYEMMLKLEEDLDLLFIPSYHTFSYLEDRKPLNKEVSTPPLKRVPERNTEDLPENTIYVMLSGTGSEMDTLMNKAKAAQESGYHVIVPPWAPETKENFERRGPEVISHNHVRKVIARPGWGILWTCQNAETEIEHVPYSRGDEPEIYFNIKTLEAIPLMEGTKQQLQRFGTLDGIGYVVNEVIAQMEK
jgi:hypothetical protein